MRASHAKPPPDQPQAPVPPSRLDTLLERVGKIFTMVLGVFTLVCAVLHLRGDAKIDKDALYYIIVSGALFLFPNLKSFKFGQDGVSFEQFERRLSDVKKRADEANEKADLNTSAYLEGIGKPHLSMLRPLGHGVVSPMSVESDDPQKGRWGGQSTANHRQLAATVTATPNSPELFKMALIVESTDAVNHPMTGEVVFHLHPTFREPDVSVSVVNGAAELTRIAWGAFTVGAEADQGATRLELDLAGLPDAPPLFRSR